MTSRTTAAPRRLCYELIGLRKNSASDGRSEFELPDNPNLGNSRGDVHGAAIFGLLDAACAEAARSSFPPGTGCATVSLTASFMEPGRGGLIARGTVLRAGSRIVTVEAEACDQAGALIAKAHGTVAVVRPHGKS